MCRYEDNAKHLVVSLAIIALSTFIYKLKNFLIYAVISLGAVNTAYADNFKASDFLKLQSINQKFWIEGSIDTMLHIASSRDKKQGKCILKWYYGDKKAQRNGLILAAMQKYHTEQPTTIMLALLEQACGKFR